MKVILLQDINKLGKKHDVKDIADGYARNFLIPRGLAKLATKQALKWLKTQKQAIAKIAEEELKKFKQLSHPLMAKRLLFRLKLEKKENYLNQLLFRKF